MQTTLLKKTELGAQALKTRDPVLSQRLRAAFILFDGHKSVAQVAALLPAAGPGALSAEDVQGLLQAGLLEAADAVQAAPAAAAPLEDTPTEPATVSSPDPLSPAEQSQRYMAAYPVASALAADLGLRGFRLQLAVEKAQGYDGLVALLPRLREAIAAPKLQPLEKLLLEPAGG
ncbi:MAG: hypothetical protein ACN6O3_14485 [Comamonas sp.]